MADCPAPGDPLAQLARLVAIMDRLRGPDGCEWDRAQDFASIAPYTIEEAYEVADAIARGDTENLAEELGDLLLQVVFHSAIASDQGLFTLAEVVKGIADKMERRHPQIFAGHAPTEVQSWEEIKAAEKPRTSALDDVPLALPALMRAQKLGSRAANAGFDWPNGNVALAQVSQKLAVIAASDSKARRHDAAGDLLLALVDYLRWLDIDAEAALRDGNARHERQFRAMERTSSFASPSAEGKRQRWQQMKSQESQSDTD